eukprot:4991918-Pleurochrysis_carterae.AAC.2
MQREREAIESYRICHLVRTRMRSCSCGSGCTARCIATATTRMRSCGSLPRATRLLPHAAPPAPAPPAPAPPARACSARAAACARVCAARVRPLCPARSHCGCTHSARRWSLSSSRWVSARSTRSCCVCTAAARVRRRCVRRGGYRRGEMLSASQNASIGAARRSSTLNARGCCVSGCTRGRTRRQSCRCETRMGRRWALFACG